MKRNSIALLIIVVIVATVVIALQKTTRDETTEKPTVTSQSTPTPIATVTPTDIDTLALQTRNQQRRSDVGMLYNALSQYKAQNTTLAGLGNIPNCPDTIHLGRAEGNLDLYTKLVPEFMLDIPIDVKSSSSQDTGYAICVSTNETHEVHALHAEGGEVITLPVTP